MITYSRNLLYFKPRQVIIYSYTTILFMLNYLLLQKHFFYFDQLKKRFITYWVYLWNFLIFPIIIINIVSSIVIYFQLLKFLLKKYLFIRVKSIKLFFKNKLIYCKKKKFINFKKVFNFNKIPLLINLIFITYYFLLYKYYGYCLSWYGLKNIKLLINRLVLGSVINFSYYSWLSITKFNKLIYLIPYNSLFIFKYNNFLYYKWNLFLIYFRISSSLLTLVVPLRTSIIMFHKKHIMLPYLSFQSTLMYMYTSVYNRFLFFSFFQSWTTLHLSVNVIWLAVLVPRSYSTARIQFYYYYRKLLVYQRQITKYILNYYKFTIYELVKIQEYTLIRLILCSQFCFFKNFIELLFQRKFIFLNFYIISSLFIVLYPHDVISFIISINFFLFYKWQILYIDLRFNRFLYYSRFWTLRSHRLFPKQNSFRLPHWVIFYRFYFFEIPIYLEVDFLILSIILLNYYYTNLLFYYYFSFKEIPYTVIRNHNWKLLN